MKNSSVHAHSGLPPLTDGPHQHHLMVVALVVTLGGLLFGYDTGVINGALSPLSKELGLSPMGEGLVTSSLLVGAAFGALTMGKIADAIGRRKAVIILSVMFLVGVAFCCFAPGLGVLLLGRVILGMAVGGTSTVVPVFLAEMAPYEIRGTLSGRNELMIVVGQLAAFVINAIIGNVWGHIPGIWRVMLGVAALPAFALLIGMLRIPESPRWLAHKHRYDEALKAMRTIRSPERAVAEIEDIQRNIEKHGIAGEERFSVREILSNKWLLRILLVGVGLGLFQQLTGIDSVMYYGQIILVDAGFGQNAALVANIAPGVIGVLGALVALRFTERINRRTTVITGYSLTMLFHVLISGASVIFPEGNTMRPYALLVLIVLLVGAIQTFLNIATWVLLSEIFPAQMRAFGVGASVFVKWLMNAVLSLFFPSVMAVWGLTFSFFAFAIINAIAVVFMWKMLPETRGKSLEEVEEGVMTGAIFIAGQNPPVPETKGFDVHGHYRGEDAQ